MQKLIISACLLLTTAACSSLPREANVVFIDDRLAFHLLSPASFGEHVILTQLVNIRYTQQGEAQSQELLFYSEIGPEAVDVAGLLPDGTRLFSFRYDGNALHTEGRPEILGRLDPQYLLADMQIALWPYAEVRASLAQHNDCFAVSCELSESADQLRRELHVRDRELIDIRYQGLPHYGYTTHYQHHGRQYALDIETLEAQLVAAATKEAP